MKSYIEQHANPQGPGDARPTAVQIIKDANAESTLVGKVIVITGVSSGIGVETAKALLSTGATVIGTARDTKKAELATGLPIRVVEMDNSSFASIRKAVSPMPKVDILVNNAGVNVFSGASKLTEDGFDLTYQTNYLSQVYLYHLLKPHKVVNVSSSAHRGGSLNFDNHSKSYENTKLASIYMANELARHSGVIATSLNPGSVVGTEMGRHAPPEFLTELLANKPLVATLKSPEQGAATTVLAVIADFNGKYLEDCGEAKAGADDESVWSPGYVPRTYNKTAEEKLWNDTMEQLGLKETA
ncbi:MAG: hypothetical protein GOMPHAMPRED_007838 [Gomphillus americanus]|uniref:Uncharacterized protein n=1 Tax=Gomphillus americanus TaxID=1940652 RepID=A0A8H3EVQ3_9LECA|nr:MAG: hypothetical protein GOMPHAMPRED_007838 [Gomphillus americanus]